MLKDISGNSISLGDSVFIIKSFVQNHFAKTYELDEYPDVIDQELEEARARGYIDPSLPTEEDKEFEYYTNEPQTYKRYIDKDNYVPDDYDENDNDLKVEEGSKVQLLSSNAQSTEEVQTGRVIYVEPSSEDKLEQLKNTINIILSAEESGAPSVNINDFLFAGEITQENYNSEILQRSEQINSISKNSLKKDRSESLAYVQPLDIKNKNGVLKANLISLSNYVETTLIDENSKVIVNNIDYNSLLKKAESIREKIPAFLRNKTPEELLKIYPNTIIKTCFNKKPKTDQSFKEKIKVYTLINEILSNHLNKTGINYFNKDAVTAICKKVAEKDTISLKYFNMDEFFDFVNNKDKYSLMKDKQDPKSLNNTIDSNSGSYLDLVSNSEDYFTDVVGLDLSGKDTYLDNIKTLLSYLEYSDGVTKYNSNELSKLSSERNIDSTVIKLAIDIEHWFIQNESKALKSILG